ncbi:MAG: hypothetical protein K0S22_675 [Oscillospiraceae bacterium]|nr:hypothetical protein [Oscillospiraceae bacterium]
MLCFSRVKASVVWVPARNTGLFQTTLFKRGLTEANKRPGILDLKTLLNILSSLKIRDIYGANNKVIAKKSKNQKGTLLITSYQIGVISITTASCRKSFLSRKLSPDFLQYHYHLVGFEDFAVGNHFTIHNECRGGHNAVCRDL